MAHTSHAWSGLPRNPTRISLGNRGIPYQPSDTQSLECDFALTLPGRGRGHYHGPGYGLSGDTANQQDFGNFGDLAGPVQFSLF